MKKMKGVFTMKRVTSLFLIVSLLASLTAPCGLAANANLEYRLQADIESEFQIRYDAAMQSVYAQLQEQDALVLLSVYEELVRADIEAALMNEYGISSLENDDGPFYAPYGGVIHYYSEVGGGIQSTEVTVIYMDHEDGDEAHRERMRFTFEDVVELVLDFIPWERVITTAENNEMESETEQTVVDRMAALQFAFVSATASILLAAQSIGEGMRENEIMDNDYISKAIHTLNEEYNTEAHVVLAWENYPYITRIGNEDRFEKAIAEY